VPFPSLLSTQIDPPNRPHPALVAVWILCQDLWQTFPDEAPSASTVPQEITDRFLDLSVAVSSVLAAGGYSKETLRAAVIAAGRPDLLASVDDIFVEPPTPAQRRPHTPVQQLVSRSTAHLHRWMRRL
jgi:hypothetical protein